MPNKSFRTVNAVMALAITVFASGMLMAQSGRRLPKGSPPVAAPTPDAAPVAQPKPPPKPDFTVKVYTDVSFGSSFAFPKRERLQDWTVERLRKTSLLDVRDGGSARRSDSIKQAKSETEAYIVLLEVRSDTNVPYGVDATNAVSVVLTVFHPVSAKVKFSRSLSVGQNSTRLPRSSAVLQACYPGVYGNDLLLLDASIQAADSVMNLFNIPLPQQCRGSGI